MAKDKTLYKPTLVRESINDTQDVLLIYEGTGDKKELIFTSDPSPRDQDIDIIYDNIKFKALPSARETGEEDIYFSIGCLKNKL